MVLGLVAAMLGLGYQLHTSSAIATSQPCSQSCLPKMPVLLLTTCSAMMLPSVPCLACAISSWGTRLCCCLIRMSLYGM